jgi:hypothetical protein
VGRKKCSLQPDCCPKRTEGGEEARATLEMPPSSIKKSVCFVLIIMELATGCADSPNWIDGKCLWWKRLKRLSTLRSNFMY